MGFWRFANEAAISGLSAISPTYDYQLGWLAGLLAVFAGFALFPSLARVRQAGTVTSRRAWYLGGATTMSIGFWGTQNMALLAMNLPTAYVYDALTGFAALLPCMAGCAGAIRVLADPRPSITHLHAGAASLSLGVAAMHYTLMEAIRGDIILVYDSRLFVLSLALGYGFSLVALYVNSGLSRWRHRSWAGSLGGSLLLGVTVLGNHYSAMAGTGFFDDPAIISTANAVVPAATIPLVAGCVLFLICAYWVGSVVDGRLAEASAAVRSSEARNRAVIETMMDAHIITDHNGLIRSFNPAAAQTFGWAATEIIGQPVRTLINQDTPAIRGDWSRHSEMLVTHPASSRRWIYGDGGRRKDGTLFPIELAISPFNVDGAQLFSCTVRDLSERWEAESRLRRLAAAIEQAGDAITILDAERRIQYVNPQYERQSGYRREEMIGQQPGRGASTDEVYAGIWETVGQGRVWTGQVRTRRRDNSILEEELTMTPVFDAGGSLSGYVAVMRDITDRRRLEAQAQLRQRLESIGQIADGIAAELAIPAQLLGDNMELAARAFRGFDGLLTELTVLAHSRTPIAPAVLAGCLQNADVDFLRGRIASALEQSNASRERIASVVAAMRDITYSSPEKTRIDLNRAIRSTITVSQSEWHAAAEVRTHFDPDLPHVECVAGDISLVVMNALISAAQAIQAGNRRGIRGKGVIDVTTRHGGGCAEILISRTGRPPGNAEREAMFDPRTASPGMVMAHDVVVNRHGGTIALQSDEGRSGATLVIRLPLETATIAGQAPRAAAL